MGRGISYRLHQLKNTTDNKDRSDHGAGADDDRKGGGGGVVVVGVHAAETDNVVCMKTKQIS